jgi:hypothetical protein
MIVLTFLRHSLHFLAKTLSQIIKSVPGQELRLRGLLDPGWTARPDQDLPFQHSHRLHHGHPVVAADLPVDLRPGIDFIKLLFGPKTFSDKFYPQILDEFPPKNNSFKLVRVFWRRTQHLKVF